MFTLGIVLLFLLVCILEVLIPSLSFVLPALAIGLDVYIAFLIVRWIVEKFQNRSKR